MVEQDLDDMDEVKHSGKEKCSNDEKNEWADEEFSFDSIWDRLPHISLYQDPVKKVSKLVDKFQNDFWPGQSGGFYYWSVILDLLVVSWLSIQFSLNTSHLYDVKIFSIRQTTGFWLFYTNRHFISL